jgi:hypothetical protein
MSGTELGFKNTELKKTQSRQKQKCREAYKVNINVMSSLGRFR